MLSQRPHIAIQLELLRLDKRAIRELAVVSVGEYFVLHRKHEQVMAQYNQSPKHTILGH